MLLAHTPCMAFSVWCAVAAAAVSVPMDALQCRRSTDAGNVFSVPLRLQFCLLPGCIKSGRGGGCPAAPDDDDDGGGADDPLKASCCWIFLDNGKREGSGKGAIIFRGVVSNVWTVAAAAAAAVFLHHTGFCAFVNFFIFVLRLRLSSAQLFIYSVMPDVQTLVFLVLLVASFDSFCYITEVSNLQPGFDDVFVTEAGWKH